MNKLLIEGVFTLVRGINERERMVMNSHNIVSMISPLMAHLFVIQQRRDDIRVFWELPRARL